MGEEGAPATAYPAGVIDTKLVGRPDKFSGKDEDWDDWKYGFMN